MCFRVKTEKWSGWNSSIPKPKKARKDIVVYKALSIREDGPYFNLRIDGKVEGYNRGFIYSETTPFATAQHYGRQLEVNGHAFHVNKSMYLAKQHSSNVKLMVIPKGALYYENVREYVTSELWYPTEEEAKVLRNKKK